MRMRLIILTSLLCLVGCSSATSPGPSPTAAVTKFMEAAKAGDAETMTNLFSKRAIQRDGIEKTRENNKVLASLTQKAKSRDYQMKNFKESTDGTNARVAFHYQTADKVDSLRMVFALSKEDGAWKVDNIGGSELEAIADLGSSELKDPRVKKPQPVETPPTSDSSPPSLPSPAKGTIAGGVLNSKAISLPKPAYPPIAKQAHAEGHVAIEVVVDQSGKVISAHAVSGHPMLRAPAVAAAYGAKFAPVKLGGEPVKVTGIITFDFQAQ